MEIGRIDWLTIGIVGAIVMMIGGVLVIAFGPGSREKEEDRKERFKRSGPSGFVIFLAVVLGILVAIWIASKIFRVEIAGVIFPIR